MSFDAKIRAVMAAAVVVIGVAGAILAHAVLSLRAESSPQDESTRFDPHLGWATIPNSSSRYDGSRQVRTNASGYRSSPIDRSKKWIVVMGDSVAWGNRVADHQTFSAVLDGLVSRAGYQVHNMSVSGYSIDQLYLRLKMELPKLGRAEHVVLVICTYNDLMTTGCNAAYGKRKPTFVLRGGELLLTDAPIEKYCMRNVVSASPILRGFERAFSVANQTPMLGDRCLSRAGREEVAARLLREISGLSRSYHAPLTIALSPSLDDLQGGTRSDYAWFKALMEREHYDYLDLKAIIQAAWRPDQFDGLFIPENDAMSTDHYSASGHRFVAEVLREKIAGRKHAAKRRD